MIHLPAAVRNKAVTAGAAGWIDDLPTPVANLEYEWSIEVGRPLDGGTEAFVAEATLTDVSKAVLKVLVARPGEHLAGGTGGP